MVLKTSPHSGHLMVWGVRARLILGMFQGCIHDFLLIRVEFEGLVESVVHRFIFIKEKVQALLELPVRSRKPIGPDLLDIVAERKCVGPRPNCLLYVVKRLSAPLFTLSLGER